MAVPVKPKRILGYSPFDYAGRYPFESLFTSDQNCQKEGFEGIDCFLLSGGTDWHPSYYNQHHHPFNYAPKSPSERDIFEWKAMLYCRANDIPMLGICRGAQGLCIGAGGSLIQHVDGHNYDHLICTKDGEIMLSTSVHHQMMNPWKVPHEVLAWADQPRTGRYEDGFQIDVREMKDHDEPEIVYFPEIKGLAIQGHPEYAHASNTFQDYCNLLVEEYLLK